MNRWTSDRVCRWLVRVCASCETLVSSLNDQWETESLHYILFFFLTMICEIKRSTFDDKQAHQVSVVKYLSQFQLRWKLSIKKYPKRTNEKQNSLTWTVNEVCLFISRIACYSFFFFFARKLDRFCMQFVALPFFMAHFYHCNTIKLQFERKRTHLDR